MNINMYNEFLSICESIDKKLSLEEILSVSNEPNLVKSTYKMLELIDLEKKQTGIEKERTHYKYIRISSYVDSLINGSMLNYDKFMEEYNQYSKLIGRLFMENEDKNTIESILKAKANSICNKYNFVSLGMILPQCIKTEGL